MARTHVRAIDISQRGVSGGGAAPASDLPDARAVVRPGVGQLWALLSALSYTAVNVLLRAAAVDIDPWLGSMLRQVPVAALAWVAVVVTRRPELAPASARFLGWRSLAALAVAGVIAFVLGNLLYFEALAAGGLGVTASGAQAGLILTGVAGAVLLLGERPGVPAYAGAAVLVTGLATIGLVRGAEGEWVLGVFLAVAAGATYAASNILVRGVQRQRPTLFVALAANSLGGLVPLLVVQLVRGGGDPLMGEDPGRVGIVLLAGAFNALALIGIVQALRHTTVATLNSIASATVVFSFAGSVLLFSEPASVPMVAGVALVAAGIVVSQLNGVRLRRPRPDARRA